MSAFPLGRGVDPSHEGKNDGDYFPRLHRNVVFHGVFCCGMEKLTFFMSERSCQICPQGL